MKELSISFAFILSRKLSCVSVDFCLPTSTTTLQLGLESPIKWAVSLFP